MNYWKSQTSYIESRFDLYISNIPNIYGLKFRDIH